MERPNQGLWMDGRRNRKTPWDFIDTLCDSHWAGRGHSSATRGLAGKNCVSFHTWGSFSDRVCSVTPEQGCALSHDGAWLSSRFFRESWTFPVGSLVVGWLSLVQGIYENSGSRWEKHKHTHTMHDWNKLWTHFPSLYAVYAHLYRYMQIYVEQIPNKWFRRSLTWC